MIRYYQLSLLKILEIHVSKLGPVNLGPVYFYSALGLVWLTALKMTKVS